MKCRHDAVVSDLKNKLNLAPDEAALSKFKVEAQAERTAKEAALEELHKLKGEVAAHKVVPIPAPPARLMEKQMSQCQRLLCQPSRLRIQMGTR